MTSWGRAGGLGGRGRGSGRGMVLGRLHDEVGMVPGVGVVGGARVVYRMLGYT